MVRPTSKPRPLIPPIVPPEGKGNVTVTTPDVPDPAVIGNRDIGTPDPGKEAVTEVAPDAVRAWAKEQQWPDGLVVSDRGRVPDVLRKAYLAAHPGTVITDAEGKTPAVTNKALAAVPLDMLDAEIVPESEWGLHPLKIPGERSEAQRKVDAMVKALNEKTNETGKLQRSKYTVDREYIPAVKYMLKQAGTFLKLVVKPAEPVNTPDGRAIILFTAQNRPVKPPAPDVTPEITTPETGKASG